MCSYLELTRKFNEFKNLKDSNNMYMQIKVKIHCN